MSCGHLNVATTDQYHLHPPHQAAAPQPENTHSEPWVTGTGTFKAGLWAISPDLLGGVLPHETLYTGQTASSDQIPL